MAGAQFQRHKTKRAGSERLPGVASLPSSNWLKPATARRSLSLRNSLCARL
jgi:hypothetical protein